MAHSLTWLPDVLKAAGLKVSEVPGWKTRGDRDVGHIFGVICHHTVGPKVGVMPSLNTLIDGRPDLPGPLAQLGLGRDGTYFIITAGRANHAGKGEFRGIVNGNSNMIGIEAENTGLPNDFPWPAVQLDAYHRGVAAILKHIGRGVEFCAGHKEYALTKAGKRGRKTDPDLDMNEFRAEVAKFMSSTAAPKPLIPAVEPTPLPGGSPGRPTLRRGASGDLVKQVQAIVGVTPDGQFGAKTEAAVRDFQRKQNLVPDGIVGPKTWRALDAVAAPV
ncbi:MAG TPA: N-acetylmuramoyl-L-alanine amidase [Pyrinomonadaceae bacterium]|nr:N-acetylmuramoyl-L-alanine amidase [Pyrinomonadaceae bacterium]